MLLAQTLFTSSSQRVEANFFQIKSIHKFFVFLLLTVAVSQAAPARALLPSCIQSVSNSRVPGKASLQHPAAASFIGVLRCGDNNANFIEKSNQTSRMSRIREAIFPIYGEERKKFFLLGSIKFFIVLALVLSRDTKDTLIVTQCGAEAIAFLKVRSV